MMQFTVTKHQSSMPISLYSCCLTNSYTMQFMWASFKAVKTHATQMLHILQTDSQPAMQLSYLVDHACKPFHLTICPLWLVGVAASHGVAILYLPLDITPVIMSSACLLPAKSLHIKLLITPKFYFETLTLCIFISKYFCLVPKFPRKWWG